LRGAIRALGWAGVARLRSILKAGYFPLPEEAAAAISALCPLDGQRHAVVDPCAGDGAALAALLRAWGPAQERAAEREGGWAAYACELEEGRFLALDALRFDEAGALGGARLSTAWGDAMTVPIPPAGRETGATVLYLNPPYDLDPQWSRLEARWLERWSRRLGPGGALIFVVPAGALPACADLLGRLYADVAALRFPDPAFEQFRQVVVFARRLQVELAEAPADLVARLSAAARDPRSLPPLWGLGAPTSPVVRPAGRPLSTDWYSSRGREQPIAAELWRVADLDVAGAIADHAPWTAQARKGRRVRLHGIAPPRGLADLGARQYPLATRPRPGHIAAAIACGVYNGVRVRPSAEGRAIGLPDALIKGAFDRRFREVEVRYDKEGNPVASLQVQQPRLRVTVLDCETYRTYELASATDPTEARELSRFSVGDLLLWYGEGLLEVLRDRCPLRFGLADPDEVRERLAAAGVARRAFDAQAEVAAAAAAGLRADGAFAITAQTGTGKTTMALCALALAGLRRPLVMAPPHLCEETWPREIAATWPDAVVVHLQGPADLYRLAELRDDPRRVAAIVSRETAKLGPGCAPVRGTCPRCRNPSSVPEDKRATRRSSCAAEVGDLRSMTPGQRAARDFAAACALAAGECEAIAPLLAGLSPRLLARRGVALAAQAKLDGAARKGDDGAAAAAARTRAERDAAARPRALAAALRAVDAARAEALAQPSVAGGAEAAKRALAAASAALLAADAPAPLLLEVARGWLAAAEAIALPDRGHRTPFAELAEAAGWLLDQAATRNGAAEAEAIRERAEAEWLDLGSRGPRCSAIRRQGESVGYLLRWSRLHKEAAPRAEVGWAEALSALLAGFGAPPRRRCGEALWTTVPEPRRVPLARLLVDRAEALGFDCVVLDEAHEYNGADSAQSAAARLLRSAGRPTLRLTGSTIGGYAAQFFEPLQELSADFRREFGPRDHARFQERYGYVRRSVDLTGQGASAAGAGAAEVEREYGAHSDRLVAGGVRVIGKAPGVMPEAILRWFLPHAGTVDLASVQRDLPSSTERIVRIAPDADQAKRGADLLAEVMREIRSARRDPERRGRLFGALAERLPSYYDLCRDDPASRGLSAFEVRYPPLRPGDEGELVCSAPAHPIDADLPKELALAEEVRAQLERGRPCLILAWHALLVEGLADRLRRLLGGRLPGARGSGPAIAHLPRSVDARKREAWISALLRKGCDILVAQPRAIETGLNNLIHYPTQVWHENPGCNPYVRRQVAGRALRIGQDQPVESIALAYDDALAPGAREVEAATAGRPAGRALQVAALELLAHKVGVSEAVDGLDATAALVAAGVGDQDATASLSVGRALYEMLARAP